MTVCEGTGCGGTVATWVIDGREWRIYSYLWVIGGRKCGESAAT